MSKDTPKPPLTLADLTKKLRQVSGVESRTQADEIRKAQDKAASLGLLLAETFADELEKDLGRSVVWESWVDDPDNPLESIVVELEIDDASVLFSVSDGGQTDVSTHEYTIVDPAAARGYPGNTEVCTIDVYSSKKAELTWMNWAALRGAAKDALSGRPKLEPTTSLSPADPGHQAGSDIEP